MDISKQVDGVIELLKGLEITNAIAIFSVFIAFIALIANIVSNRKNHKQYIESLKPLLSFDFYEMDGVLVLAIKNTGKTEAKSIKVGIIQLK